MLKTRQAKVAALAWLGERKEGGEKKAYHHPLESKTMSFPKAKEKEETR